jgi:Na+/H+-dicarboxylate symporter
MQDASPVKKKFLPLYAQILIAVFLGSVAGIFFGKDSAHFFANEAMGDIGFAVIRLLKICAIPLILFAIVDTILKTEISGKNALKVVAICLFNVSVAMLIGLLVLNIFKPGKSWTGKLPTEKKITATTNESAVQQQKNSLDPVQVIVKLVPESLAEPFVKNNTIGVIIVALLFGFAFKSVKKGGETERIGDIEKLVETLFEANLKVIGFIIKIIPYAVFCLVGAAVGKSGLGIFSVLWIFLATIIAGFFLHAFIYYPLVCWIVGKKSPRIYLGRGMDAIATAFSTNSSLATIPVTLKTLTERMGISATSARMSACFATNLNNDGITLYEAMTALFLTQALGIELGLSAQIFIVLVSIFVSMGIAGIPEAGLIILPLVLSASGLSDQTIALAVALIVPIDWFIARLRSAVNVMSDMAVAILLDKV